MRAEPVDESLVRLCWNTGHRQPAGFLQPARLAFEAMKLVRGRQHPLRPAPVEAGVQPHHELVRIRRKGDLVRVGKVQMTSDVRLGFGEHCAEYPIPLAVGQANRIVPVCQLRRARHVGPWMMAVRRAVQPVTGGLEEPAEVRVKEALIYSHVRDRGDSGRGQDGEDAV
jgi:hypothetical protein